MMQVEAISTIDFVYMLMLIISLSLMMSQLFVKEKKTVHIVFAVFCGSMSMVALQQLTQQSLGIYAYIIGFGTCATCNGFWLVARALFREKNPISVRHIILALVIGLLVIAGQSINMANEFLPENIGSITSLKLSLNEIVSMLSSTVLALTFWEACRGFRAVGRIQKLQRIIFIYAFCSGVALCMIVAEVFVPENRYAEIFPYFVAFAGTQMLIAAQLIILWQRINKTSIATTTRKTERDPRESLHKQSLHKQHSKTECNKEHLGCTNISQTNPTINVLTPKHDKYDPVLAIQLRRLLKEDKLFLQAGLKMSDIAQQLQVPEYKVSNVVRYAFQGGNFNQYINVLRVQYAQTLLEQEATSHWSILVIGLESGFASIGPFNRAFKKRYHCTPSEYRQQLDYQQFNLVQR